MRQAFLIWPYQSFHHLLTKLQPNPLPTYPLSHPLVLFLYQNLKLIPFLPLLECAIKTGSVSFPLQPQYWYIEKLNKNRLDSHQNVSPVLQIVMLSFYNLKTWASMMTQQVKNLPAMQETSKPWVRSLGQEDPLEKKMATQSSILA